MEQCVTAAFCNQPLWSWTVTIRGQRFTSECWDGCCCSNFAFSQAGTARPDVDFCQRSFSHFPLGLTQFCSFPITKPPQVWFWLLWEIYIPTCLVTRNPFSPYMGTFHAMHLPRRVVTFLRWCMSSYAPIKVINGVWLRCKLQSRCDAEV